MVIWRVYRKYVIVTLAAVLLTVAISYINRDPGYWQTPEILWRSALQPFQQIAQGAADRMTTTWQEWQQWGSLREENQRLQEALEEKEYVMGQMKELEAENQRLAELLQLAGKNPELDTLAARVVARDPDNWHEGLTINRGSEHGVEPDMPVLDAAGLVGRVVEVGPRQADVLLLSDQRSSVGAMMQDSREPGVVRGYGVGDEPLRMLYISPEAEIDPGERVVTSGLGSIFPKGLPIGKVIDVRHDEHGLGQYAVVEPGVDFFRLEEVLVVVAAGGATSN